MDCTKSGRESKPKITDGEKIRIRDLPTTRIRKDIWAALEERYSTIKSCISLRGYKLKEKQNFLTDLIHASVLAIYNGSCISYSRNKTKVSRLELQVIEAATEAGLFLSITGDKGKSAEYESRLVPLPKLIELVTEDNPWDFEKRELVTVKERGGKARMEFDHTNKIAKEYQHGLEALNNTNDKHDVAYHKQSPYTLGTSYRLRLRPYHFSVFTGSLDMHGRIYTGLYGHQALSKKERKTIQIDDEETVELDYSGLHTRMLYHIEKIDYTADPYILSSDYTTPYHRRIGKLAVNALINASTFGKAILACRAAASTQLRGKPKKTGKDLKLALNLIKAVAETGLQWGKVIDSAMLCHEQIAHHFGIDIGARLMTIDARIALDVLYHFALLGRACLSCHDSFIVQKKYENDLREVMIRKYQDKMGFPPVITKS
jgi:hypothetical protein